MATPFALSAKAAATKLELLQSQIEGPVLLPWSTGYDEARKAWNLTVEQHPEIIVIAKSAADVAAAVRFAREAELGIAVQATGHGVGVAADENSMLIVTAQMTKVYVDMEFQTAWVEGGTKWGKVLEVAQEVGLAPLLGSSPDVGAVGYTLGGGLGWLGRKYGLSADSVLYFEVVTADGRLIKVSADENSDLFWGLRGGGGGFGVVTGMEIQLYPVTTIYGGNLIYPIEDAKAVYSRYREWIADMPDELTTSIVIMNYPPIPDVPEFLRGQSFVQVRGAYTGAMEDGEAMLRYWRDWKTPIFDLFGPMPFSQIANVSSEPVDPVHALSTSLWLRDLSDEAIDTIIRYGVAKNGLVVTEIRQAGGVISRVDKQANAYGNRDATMALHLISITPTPEAWSAVREYTSEFKREMQPYATGGVYINFLEGHEKQARTKDAFTPENYQRLAALKAKYDPENRFRYSVAIAPAKKEAK